MSNVRDRESQRKIQNFPFFQSVCFLEGEDPTCVQLGHGPSLCQRNELHHPAVRQGPSNEEIVIGLQDFVTGRQVLGRIREVIAVIQRCAVSRQEQTFSAPITVEAINPFERHRGVGVALPEDGGLRTVAAFSDVMAVWQCPACVELRADLKRQRLGHSHIIRVRIFRIQICDLDKARRRAADGHGGTFHADGEEESIEALFLHLDGRQSCVSRQVDVIAEASSLTERRPVF